MGIAERIFHSVLFETLAVTLSIIGLALFTDHDIAALSGTMIVVATMAMCWNYLFNLIFDHFVQGEKTLRSLQTRLVHVVLFEAGLLLATIPAMAYLLEVSLFEAFVMDIGVTIFITIYAFLFNFAYDHARVWMVDGRVAIVK